MDRLSQTFAAADPTRCAHAATKERASWKETQP